jgi:hypothetical protein
VEAREIIRIQHGHTGKADGNILSLIAVSKRRQFHSYGQPTYKAPNFISFGIVNGALNMYNRLRNVLLPHSTFDILSEEDGHTFTYDNTSVISSSAQNLIASRSTTNETNQGFQIAV